MRRIILTALSICVGVALALAGCRKADQADQAGSGPNKGASAQVRVTPATVSTAPGTDAVPGAQAQAMNSPESGRERPGVEIADESVAVNSMAGLAETGGVALPQPPDLEGVAASERPAAAQRWLQTRSKALLEKEKALMAHKQGRETDALQEGSSSSRTMWSEPRPPAVASGTDTANPSDNGKAGISAMASPAPAAALDEPDLDTEPVTTASTRIPPLPAGGEDDRFLPVADDGDNVEPPVAPVPMPAAAEDDGVPPLTLAETSKDKADVKEPDSPAPERVWPPLPPVIGDQAGSRDAARVPAPPRIVPEVPGMVDSGLGPTPAIAANGDDGAKPAPADGEAGKGAGGEQPAEDPRARKARELADKEARKERLQQASRRAESAAKFRAGLNLFNNQLYEEALAAFEQSLARDPGNRRAREYRDKCRQLLDRPSRDNADILIRTLSDREKAQMDAVAMQTRADLEHAAKLLLKALSPDTAQRLKPRDQQIQGALANLEIAKEKLRKVETVLASSPLSAVRRKELQLQVQALKVQVEDTTSKLLAEQEDLERREAVAAARRRRLSTQKIRRERLARLLKSAAFNFNREQYDKAADLATEVLKMDPNNGAAMEMRTKALAAAHTKMEATNARDMHDSEVNWTLDVRKQAIMPSADLIYPPDEEWERIKRRVSRKRAIAAGSILEKQIRDKLTSVRVTIDYNETPINDVLRELSDKGGVNIIANSDVDPDTTVSLTVTNMTLQKVLDWIMKLKELHYEIRNEAVYVSREKRRNLVMQLYPVFDLTRALRDYYPTNHGDDDDDDDDDDTGPEIVDIKDRITRIVAPDTWSDEGVTLELWEDNLLVMQSPEVHAELLAYLNKLREASKQQVLVEGRFLNITKNFLEELGVTWDAIQERRGMPSTPLVRDGHGVVWNKLDDGRNVRITGSLLPGGATPPNTTAGQGLNAIIAHLMMDAGTGGIGSLRQFEINAVLHALQEKKQGSVMHNPRLLVANGRNAYLQIYTTTNYISSWTQQGTVFQPEVQNYEQGVEWSVRPVISFDRKYITIRVRPRLVAFDPVNSMNRVDHRIVVVSSAGGTNVTEEQDLPYLLPVIETTELESFVTIPDGGTVLMGGLIHDQRHNNISGIPLISSIPMVGRAFRTERHRNEQRNIVIMVQGKIIELEE